MISFKYLVTFFSLLLAACGGALAASDSSTDTPTTASATSSTDASSGTSSTVRHHRKHHSATAADGTNAAPATASTTSGSSTENNSTPASTKGQSSSRAASTPAATPATTLIDASTDSTSTTHSKKKHGSTTADSTAAAASYTDATSTASAGTSTTSTTTDGSTAKSRHHRHGKTTAATTTNAAPVATTPPAPASIPANAPAVGVPAVTSAPVPAVNGAVPTVQTGLPVARPGAGTTAGLPVGAAATPKPMSPFTFTDFPHRPTHTYPWKLGIKTTVFWIGEGGSTVSSTTNISSAWDIGWTHHNGGGDDPSDMSYQSGYSYLNHASTVNPFYIALPFNDLAYPDKAARWVPSHWLKPQRRGEKPVSACKDRWIEIKNRAGRVCYAQWEDVGPLVSDHAEYVFGPERPNTMTGAGLDVSPAVAKYLGIDETAYTSWRFVDDDEVQPGMWLRYDEQAILFQALKEQSHRGPSTPRMQDLSEPVPDGSDEDSNQKKAGAARG